MFELIRSYLFQMRVQAELKAQYDDQAFINRVCHAPDILKEIYDMRVGAYFNQDKVAPFLAVCQVLNLAMSSEAFNQETRSICAALLAQRLQRIAEDSQFRLRHLLMIGELEERVRDWATDNVEPALMSQR